MEFTKRVWIFIPIFSGIIAIPAVFLTPGTPLFHWGPFTATREGGTTALLLILRVSTSVSFTVLLILTTPWNSVIRALEALKLPSVLVSLLSTSYRYLLLLLRTLSELLMARRSRVIGNVAFKRELGFLSRSTGYLFLRSLHLAEGVQMAMVSRGHSAFSLDEPSTGTTETGEAGEEKSGAGNIYELEQLEFRYPDGILGVRIGALSIPKGVCTILLGPNGSGKSTLLKLLDGLIFPQEGRIRFLGETLTENRLAGRAFHEMFRSRVGLVFQDADIMCFSPTVREELSFGPAQKRMAGDEIDRKVEKVMKLLSLDSIAERYPYRLSGGEKKRVAIASVLTVDPDVYLMDEPTANLDPSTEGTLIDLLADLRESGKTLVIATQDLLLTRHIGDRGVVLGPERHLIAEGPIESILEDPDTLREAHLLHAHRVPHGEMPPSVRHTHYSEDEDG